jgi:hypothetical protein
MKAIARLGLGWLLMFAGAVLLWESGTAIHPRSRTFTAVEALGGFALMAGGVWLRHTATRSGTPR